MCCRMRFSQWITEKEGISRQEYLKTYVDEGWGGIPELHQCARRYVARFYIWDYKNRCLACIGTPAAKTIGYLKYVNEHYSVDADPNMPI